MSLVACTAALLLCCFWCSAALLLLWYSGALLLCWPAGGTLVATAAVPTDLPIAIQSRPSLHWIHSHTSHQPLIFCHTVPVIPFSFFL